MKQSIASQAHIGAITLTVADLDRLIGFYQSALGFKIIQQHDNICSLGVGGRELLILREDRQAKRPLRSAGLYHFAVLLPSRKD